MKFPILLISILALTACGCGDVKYRYVCTDDFKTEWVDRSSLKGSHPHVIKWYNLNNKFKAYNIPDGVYCTRQNKVIVDEDSFASEIKQNKGATYNDV